MADLGPLPDAGEYAVSTQNLARHGLYVITLLHHHYPPRYPFGFAALAAPSYWLPHATLANGIYSVIAFGVLSVLLVFALSWLIGGPIAATFASLALLLLPQFIAWNHQVMSETATIFITAASMIILYLAVKAEIERRRLALLFVLGALCGLSILIRLNGIILFFAVCIALLFDPLLRRNFRRETAVLSIGPICALLMLALYARVTFGSMSGTGYRFWVPYWYTSLGRTFSLSYAVRSPGSVGDPAAPTMIPNLAYYLRGLAGLLPDRSLIMLSTWTLLLVVTGMVVGFRDSRHAVRVLTIFSCVFMALTLVFFSGYFFESVRFMSPLAPAVTSLAGMSTRAGFCAVIYGWRHRSYIRSAFGVVVILVSLVSLVTAINPTLEQCYTCQSIVNNTNSAFPFQWQSTTAALYSRAIRPHGTVISDVSLLFLQASGVSDRDRIIPLTRSDYWASPLLARTHTFEEQVASITAAVNRGERVYTDFFSVERLRAAQALAPTAWKALGNFRLTPVSGDGPAIIYRVTVHTAASTASQ